MVSLREEEVVGEGVLDIDERLFLCNLGAFRLTASTAWHGRWRRRRRWWWRHIAGCVCVVACFWKCVLAQSRVVWYGVVDGSSDCKVGRVGVVENSSVFVKVLFRKIGVVDGK
jgi:hypothetical protein